MGRHNLAEDDLAGFAQAAGRVVPVAAVGLITRPDNEKISLLRWCPDRLGLALVWGAFAVTAPFLARRTVERAG